MPLNIAIYGASGYTGSELIRLLTRHPEARIAALSAGSNAGTPMATLFPQFSDLHLPVPLKIDELDLTDIDVLFCALPHGTTQTALRTALELKPTLKVVDLSADFRLADLDAYEKWYGHPHGAAALQKEAVYGLTEQYRDKVAPARLVANPGCHTTTALLPLIPLVSAGAIDPATIVINSASGMSGAGRAAKVGMLFSEVSEGFHAYGVGHHRHVAELDQELLLAAGAPVMPTFTPHLTPMNRGIYATITAHGDPATVHKVLAERYAEERFVTVLPMGEVPHSRHVRGSNFTRIGVVADRGGDKVIVLSTLDNLVKGASGQAVQNMNVVCGLPEAMGLEQLALFP